MIGVALKKSLSNHYGDGDGDNNARHSFSCLTIERSSHARFVHDLLFLRISQPFWSYVLDKKNCSSFFFSIYECHIQVFITRNTRISFHKGLTKQGNIIAETMFLVMFPGVAELENICFGRKI